MVTKRKDFDESSIIFSGMFLMMAQEMRGLAEAHRGEEGILTVDGNNYSWRVANAVVLCAMSLEAGANEIDDWLAHHPSTPFPTTPGNFEWLPIDVKWSLLAERVGAPIDKSRPPWEDFKALIALRNALAHPKVPRGPSTQAQPRDALALLQKRSCTIRMPEVLGAMDTALQEDDWFKCSMTSRTAAWAIKTAQEMFAALSACVLAKVTAPPSYWWIWNEIPPYLVEKDPATAPKSAEKDQKQS